MLWAYTSISQLLIIWQGNLPEEITWYMPRLLGAWKTVSVLLVVFHFFIPFFCLLQGRIKRDPARLLKLIGLLVIMRIVDLLWVVGASLHLNGATALLLPVAVVIAIIGLGGIWISWFARQLRSRALTLYPEPLSEAGENEARVAS
jgi:hypothetical protein